MQQAKIYWDLEHYVAVEKVFRKSVEFCNENDVWKLNVAHVLFMQDNKFKEAIGFYEPIVKKYFNNVSNFSVCCPKLSLIRSIRKYCDREQCSLLSKTFSKFCLRILANTFVEVVLISFRLLTH
jgi:hypothetical protein